MRRNLLSSLTCRNCRLPLGLDETDGTSEHVVTGALTCSECGVVVPIARGFPFFTEADIFRRNVEPLLGTEETYRVYRQRKFERGELEIYAAFHPFNESLRATEPLLPIIEKNLKAGDIILEPWARTGWTAAWLAARFPEQRVVALWQGDSSVLGYKGFAHWFAQERRPANLEVLFVHPERGLPFGDHSIAAIFSHDCFHRFGVDTFGAELLRVASEDAPILLAHTHLSNSQPEPWFERGGTIRHGRDYRTWLDRVCSGTSRRGWIWSEADLFGAAELPADSPDMSHYNAVILIAEPNAVRPRGEVAHDRRRLLLNPLYRLYGDRSEAKIERAHLDGLVGHMLDRHPVYQPRLAAGSVPLTDRDWLLIAAAACGTEIGQLPMETGMTPEEVSDRLAFLSSADLVRSVEASQPMGDLQRFHANQLDPRPNAEDCAALCSRATLLGPQGFTLSGEEFCQSVQLVAGALVDFGAESGAMVTVGPEPHPLAVVMFMAALSLGCDVTLDPGYEGVGIGAGSGPQKITYGWDGESGGLLSLLEQAQPSTGTQLRADQYVLFKTGQGQIRFGAKRLLEASCALRHALAPVRSIERAVSPADWISIISSIARGNTVSIC